MKLQNLFFYAVLTPIVVWSADFSLEEIHKWIPKDLDEGSVINDSYNFLKEREPEMTDNEYALYEQVLPMVFDRPDFAVTLLETLLADDEEESPAFAFALANVYFSSERYDLAERYYKDAVQRYPNFVRCWSNLATLYYSQERYADAVPCFIEAIRLGESEAQTLGLLGYCLKATGNPIAAETIFQQAYAAEPTNADWIDALYACYMDSGNYSRARLLAEQLTRIEQEDVESWMRLAGVCLAEGNKAEAMVALDMAHTMGIAGSKELLLLGDLYAEQKLYEQASRIYGEVFKLDPNTGFDRLLYYTRSLIAQTHYDQAERTLQTIEKQIPEGAKMKWLLTWVRLEMDRKDWQSVVSRGTEALAIMPLDGECLFSVATACRELGELDKAGFYFQQSCQIEDYRFLSHVQLANLAVGKRQYQQAIRHIRSAMEIENRPELEEYFIRVKAMMNIDSQQNGGA